MLNYYMNNSPSRQIKAKVELYNGSTLLNTFSYTDKLKSFEVERLGEEGKFFGFGIITKATIKLLDTERELNITTEHSFSIGIGNKETEISQNFPYDFPFPTFYVTEITRDENTNELTVIAYDKLYKIGNQIIKDFDLGTDYSIGSLSLYLSETFNIGISSSLSNYTNFNLEYPNGANLEGNETIRQVLDAMAEAAQFIYYMERNYLRIKEMDRDGDPVLTITKEDYFTLKSEEPRTLAAIINTTELGDSVEVKMEAPGVTQVIRDNPFLELRDDVINVLNTAITTVGGMTFTPFECSWRGNYGLEPGDKIAIEGKNDELIVSYVVNDVISYEGGLKETTSWKYTEQETATPANPSTIGEAIKQTYARVDKVNKEIKLLASVTDANTQAISTLQINTEGINASVKSIEDNVNGTLENLQESLGTLTKEVEAKVSSDNLSVTIREEIAAAGVDKVITSTGVKVDKDGILVDKSDSEITTRVSEDGISVYRENEEVLEANNEGVKAANLHATTYLIIGENSRLEDYEVNGQRRTGCFWIGE